MKLPGCEIPGTAARTLAPLTNFPRAAAQFPIRALKRTGLLDTQRYDATTTTAVPS